MKGFLPYLLILVIITSITNGNAQNSSKQVPSIQTKDSILEKHTLKIEKQKLLEDFDQFLLILKKHPDQFKFISQKDYDILVSKQLQKIKDSMTIREFYKTLAPIKASMGCLHSRLVDNRFFKIPYKYWLPLIIRYENQKMYAINNCVATPEMTLGSEILQINGESASTIYKNLKSIISADAFNPNFYDGDLNVNFMYYYHTYYGFSDIYSIQFKPYKSDKIVSTQFDINLPAPDYKTELNNKPRLYYEENKKEKSALIKIKNFNFFSRGKQNIEYFKTFIDSSIIKAKNQGTSKFIFDLRGNRGGNPECTNHLLAYLINTETSFYENNELNLSKNRPVKSFPHKNHISKTKPLWTKVP